MRAAAIQWVLREGKLDLYIIMMVLFPTPQKVPAGMQKCNLHLHCHRGVIITKRGVITLLQWSITGVSPQCRGVIILIGFLRWSNLPSCFENILLLHYKDPTPQNYSTAFHTR